MTHRYFDDGEMTAHSGPMAVHIRLPNHEVPHMGDGGLLTPGNIDLSNRPVVKNPDGSVSTVRSMSVNIDGKEVLIPTVVNGRVVSDKEAINHYMRTGEHLGMFDSVDAANAFAQKLHEQEEQRVVKKAVGGLPLLPADRATNFRDVGEQPDDRIAQFGEVFLSSLPEAVANTVRNNFDLSKLISQYVISTPRQKAQMVSGLPDFLKNAVASIGETIRTLPEKVAAATPETAGKFAAQFTSDTLLDPTRLGKTQTMTNIIKPKGGNWLGRVEPVVKELKSPETYTESFYSHSTVPEYFGGPQGRIENYKAQLDELKDSPFNENYTQELAGRIQNAINNETPKAALDNWLDQKLNKYIRNEFATSDDPIRKQIEEFAVKKEKMLEQKDQQISKAMLDLERARAERGVNPEMLTRSQARLRELRREREYINKQSGSHVDPFVFENTEWIEQMLPEIRKERGYEPQGIGKTPLSKGWESISDISISPSSAGDLLKNKPYEIGENAWLDKVPPETLVYKIAGGNFDVLNFSHLRDELRNALDPASDLPESLKLTPDKLQKLNVAQASKLVDEINAFRATRVTEANAARAGNIATVPIKEYPERGLKWVELRLPDYSMKSVEERKQIISDLYKEAETKGLDPVKYVENYPRAALKDALKYEGEMLKHCVGGYCEDVESGRSRIFSLRDEEGRPRVTIEVVSQKPISPERFYYSDLAPESLSNRLSAFWADKKENPGGSYNNWEQFIKESPEYKTYVQSLPKTIRQVKAENNAKPRPEDIPLVQDFIRSGNYEITGDLRHTDLIDLDSAKIPPFNEVSTDVVAYTKARNNEWNAIKQARAKQELPRYITKEEGQEYLKKQGLSRGGVVYTPAEQRLLQRYATR